MEKQKLSTHHNLLQFQNSLALQCFINEFIYEETEEETIAIQSLEASLKKTFSNNEELSSCDIACLASYRSLLEYPWATDITPPLALERLFKHQVAEPNQELKLKENIPKLNTIKDDISLAVQNQYEENPYPRWINTRLAIKPMSIQKIVADLKLQVINKAGLLPEAPQVLIAGCGTGQHSLGAATRFKNSHLTAIDLSLPSLAYAKRKTEEFGITNIEYMQADILNLKMLNKEFDVIESAGVLHHMADPVAGWKVLTGCLKPNGLMKIGLYSELARSSIAEAREIISKDDLSSNKADMLRFRKKIITLDNSSLNILKKRETFIPLVSYVIYYSTFKSIGLACLRSVKYSMR